MSHRLADELRAVGLAAGLTAVGVAAALPFRGTRAELERRREAGLHAGMQFTFRNPRRSTDPSRSLPGARSIVVGALSYWHARAESSSGDLPERSGRPHGRVARYARRDHYGALRRALVHVEDRLVAAGWRAVVLADDNALVDREAARRAGIGFYGKSSNLLLPGRGSWFLLGSVVTDAPLETAAEPPADECGTCRRCIEGCPTAAIIAPGVVDARRCLAWLLQAEGDFPLEHRAALGDRIYGCDDCQEVCPPNRVLARQRPGRTSRQPDPTSVEEAWVDLIEMLDSSDDELICRHGRWYVPRRDPRFLRRNALVALGNVGDGNDPAVVCTLQRYLGHPDEMLRSHARWAAVQMGRADLAQPAPTGRVAAPSRRPGG